MKRILGYNLGLAFLLYLYKDNIYRVSVVIGMLFLMNALYFMRENKYFKSLIEKIFSHMYFYLIGAIISVVLSLFADIFIVSAVHSIIVTFIIIMLFTKVVLFTNIKEIKFK